MKTTDKLFTNLCNKIDYLEEQVLYWKDKFEAEQATNNQILNENLAIAKKGLANAFLFAISASDDEHGNLVISKDNRKELAKNYITE